MNAESNDHGGRSLETDGGSGPGRIGPDRSTSTGLERNVAAALSYVLLFVSGIALYLLEDDEFVRFHAAQSIVVFGGLAVANVVIGSLLPAIGSVAALLNGLVSLVTLALWVLLIVTAHQGRTIRVPVAAGIADDLASRAVGSTRSSGYGGTGRNGSASTDPIDTLRERYARGEIDEAEFERKLDRLLEREERDRTEPRGVERSER